MERVLGALGGLGSNKNQKQVDHNQKQVSRPMYELYGRIETFDYDDEDENIDYLVRTKLHDATIEEFRRLIEQGEDLNIADKEGRTPLYFICQDGDNDMVKELLDHGADVDSAGCLHVALENYNNDVAETLIERGCDVNKVR